MKEFSEFITEDFLLEKADVKGRHLTHIEDLPFSGGDEGIEHAANVLDDLDTMLSGKQKQSFNAPKAKSFVAGKFDGAPAIIFGRDPETKQFFVASKFAFNATPKINYTMEDIEKNHGGSPGLADKLRQALMYLPSVAPKKGVYQGDFMYDRWTIKKGDKYHEWTPNTITYKVKSSSEEGRKALRAKFGIVIHTKYDGKSLGDLQPTPYVDTENFGENSDVHLMPAKVDMNPENWKPKDRADFTNALENAKIIYGKMKPDAFDEVTKHSDLLDLYFNETVKGKTHTDVDEYVKFLTRRAEKESSQFKTPGRQESVRRKFGELIKHVQANQRNFKAAFDLRNHLTKAKAALMTGIKQNTSDYEYSINGKKTGPEGYVVYREGQDAVKLVDRKEFSKLNFELAKMKKPTHPVPAIPPMVMAFGRMNPPTGGHEGVINKVQEVASKANAAHEIVLSHSEDPEKNPLTPEQKVKYARKFFPGANITAATKDAPDFLTHAARMYAAGHRELIMVAGPDRAENFRKTLAAYNGKPGRHGYFKFDHIKVEVSERVPGKSGTEMRNYAAHGDYDSFKKGLPTTASDTDVRSLYRDVKRAQQHKPVLKEGIDKRNLVPALKDFRTGKLMLGKRGQTHADITTKHGWWTDHEVGFYDTQKKKWHNYSNLDSSDLMTKVQRMRYFGTEEQKPNGKILKEAIARGFLHKFKQIGRKFAPQTDCGPRGTSAGACALSSYALHTTLKKKGHDTHFVVGHYDDKGVSPMKKYGTKKIMAGDVNHAWVVSGGKIHDVTHNQFGPGQTGYTKAGKVKRYGSWKPVGPAVVKTNVNDPRYTEYKRDDSAIRHLRKWPSEQRPSKKNLSSVGVREEKWVEPKETRLDPVLKSRLVPAIQHKKTGTLIKGKRGDEHFDIIKRSTPGWNNPGLSGRAAGLARANATKVRADDYHAGFYDTGKKKFYPNHYVQGHFIDTPDLMTRTQRIRRYGDFAEETEMLLEAGLVVARRFPSGKVKYGKPGWWHGQLINRSEDDESLERSEMGFAQGPGKPFMTRKAASRWVNKHEKPVSRELRLGKRDSLESMTYKFAKDRVNNPVSWKRRQSNV